MNEYSLKKKKQLAKKIGKIKNKKILCEICYIIKKNNNVNSNEVNRHLFMYFHNLSSKTYHEIEKYLDGHKLKKVKKTNSVVSEDDFKPYSQDDLPSQKHLSPKLKYSNREKSLIKRRRYDDKLNEYTEEDIVYCDFNSDITPKNQHNESET